MPPVPPFAGISALKLALMAKEARAQAAGILRADPIAIVGMACRVPGGCNTPEELWALLRDGRDGVREVPADRWNADRWFDPDPSTPGKALTKWGGFLERIDGFDADYFGILSREAERMDPQQRLVLEVACEALDDAGLAQSGLSGSRTGVFIASYHNDYTQLQYRDVEEIDERTLIGTLHSVLANRLSYFLDLRGPSISIDTACSSSLVAIHLACQSLRFGETDLAIAGGVSLIITPDLMVSMSKVGFMAPDGRCKTFDASADGFGRGEGSGIVVLKRLADAIAGGDRVLAVVRGSAVNQDGHSTVIAAPNGPAQQALILEALASAQLEPQRIGLLEAHGTGTALGDPIEVEAIAATVGREHPGTGPCYLGSVKANLGHLEAAAGVVGLIKAVLALRHGAVPPQVNFTRLSPHLSLDRTRLVVPRALEPWAAGLLPRCAAVSSFGVGGTNAHVIVEEAPRLAAPPAQRALDVARILPLSAQSVPALRALAEAWIAALDQTDPDLIDLCYTAAERRSHYDVRLGVVGTTRDELRARLGEYLRDEPGSGVVAGGRPAGGAPRIGFVFCGQGPQWYAMGRELLASEPVFRAVMTECDALLRPLSGWSLLEELSRAEATSRLDQTEVAQPALFALQASLTALLSAWGIRPHGVVGHSIGEIAALHAAGVLTLAQAIRVVWHRGHVMQQATGQGRMASVGLTAEEAVTCLQPYGSRLSLAAMNGPRSVVLSGEADALEEVLAQLAARGVNHRMLPVQYAFHSAQMTPFQQRLADELSDLHGAAPVIAVYSTVLGGPSGSEAFDGRYFGRNVREPVRLASAIGAMADDGFDVFVEIGPHPVLGAAIAECLAERDPVPVILASLRRMRPERECMLQTCAGLYAAGAEPDWPAFQQAPGEVVSVPAYPWQRKRHWIRTRADAGSAGNPTGHPLLGRRLAVAGTGAQIYEGNSEAAGSWLADHRIFGRVVFPAAAVLEMFVAAATRALGTELVRVHDFVMHRALVLSEADQEPQRWQVVARLSGSGECELELHQALPGDVHAEATWRLIAEAGAATATAGPAALPSNSPAGSEPVAPAAIYSRFADLGVAFGPAFRLLTDVRRGDECAEAWVAVPAGLEANAVLYTVHPAILDAVLQLCSVAAGRGARDPVPGEVLLPLGADRIQLRSGATGRLLARAWSRPAPSGASLAADLTLETEDGLVVAVIEGMRFARAEPDAFAGGSAVEDSLYDVAWHRLPPAATPSGVQADGDWLILCDRAGIGEALIRELAVRGGRCIRLLPGTTCSLVAQDTWTIDPAMPDHFREVLRAGGWHSGAPLRGIVHLWGLDISSFESSEATAPDAADLAGPGSVLHLVQALVGGAVGAAPLWIVSRGAQVVSGSEPPMSLVPRAAGVWGLAGVVTAEHPELDLRVVDLDPLGTNQAPALVQGLLAPDGHARAAFRGGDRFVPRLERYRVRPNTTGTDLPLRAMLVRAGTLDGVEVRPMPREALGKTDLRVRVLAAGVNFRDVLLTLGMYPDAVVPLGAECAGVVTEVGAAAGEFTVGQHVFGFAPASLATEVVVPAAFVAPIPSGLRAEDAAAMPVAFLTALYGLDRLAGLQAGERVLIHAAAGGVGLAAVQLAQRRGAEIFATAGSDEKREMLRSLGVAHVLDSRSLAFADQILSATAGEGVHVVLNSLAGEFIPATLKALARGGRFVELGKRGILSPDEMRRARPDVTYAAFDLGAEAHGDRALLRPMLDELCSALADGTLRPLPVTTYPLSQLQDAFRLMAQARHIGKIVLIPPAAAEAHGASIPGSGTYWITGGLGALGLETARWLVESGARHLVLTGRRAPAQGARDAIGALEALGAQVTVREADASDEGRMREVLAEIEGSMPPLRGVFHTAGVVRDAVMVNQRWDDCAVVLRGKAHGAWVLHELTRHLPLDCFVMYSAVGVLVGAAGQGVYPAANAELDALAHARRRLGLPALSVAWGPWSGAGMAASMDEGAWRARGFRMITRGAAFAGLATLLRDGATHAAVMPMDWVRFANQIPTGTDRQFYAGLLPDAKAAGQSPVMGGPAAALVARLRATPSGQRREALLAHLRERAVHVLSLDAGTPIDSMSPLKDAGLDSLMSVELRNALTRSLGRSLPVTLLFDYPTLGGLADYLARVLDLEADVAPRARAAEPTDADAAHVATLSEAEAEALLLEELERGTSGSHRG